MKMFKVTIPANAVDEVQDSHMSFYDFLNNYGSTAWTRVVEGDWVGDDQLESMFEIMSSRREELEKIEPGVVRGMDRYQEDTETFDFTGFSWSFEIVEFNLEEGEI